MTEFLQAFKDAYVARTPHMRACGMSVESIAPARGRMHLPANPQWMGDATRGLMHTGPVIVLADSACGLAVGAALGHPKLTYATLDLRMDYLRPAGPERDTHCEAHCYRVSRSMAFIRAEVWQDDPEQPIATAQAAFMLGTPTGKEKPGQAGASAGGSGTVSTGASQDASPWRPPAASEPPLPGRTIAYVDFLGIRVAPHESQPLFRMPFNEHLIGNPYLPALHGGTVAGFAETSAILHLNQTLKGAKLPKCVDFSMDYLRAGRPEECFASCEAVRVGSRVALVTARVWQRAPDYPIAVARAHFLLDDLA